MTRGEEENKDEGPSKKLKTDFKDKRPAWQRVNTVYKPLVVPITQALMAVEGKGLLSRPRTYKDGPQRPKSDKFCQFHNDYGHTTEKCRHLKNEIERPIQNSYLQDTTHGNDALVIRALLANYEIKCVFIDSGSSADIFFGKAYDQMQLGDATLEAVDTSLHGFAGEIVHLRGMVSLPLTIETTPLRKTCLLMFLVVDIPSTYNVILGREKHKAFRAIISTYNMKIKFPIIEGVGEAQADALQARKCYVEAIKRGKKRRTEDSPETENPNERGKDPVPSPKPNNEIPATVQPVEELLTIELTLGNSGEITKIGSKMTEDVQDQAVECIRRNKDMFAWTPQDLEGIDPSVVAHHLNLDPNVKPVK
ncbi:hypothetical protein Sango_1571100 [Sesamum angolense]|uniref:Reverse transcriptase domain-containing protein n=1 Tax=Sesamum angolense TaxID=2727404 RepID=A0AAE1WPV1_9LAMI|nr:hypothetical protein Sango_1571100 [Sesamum angolense]